MTISISKTVSSLLIMVALGEPSNLHIKYDLIATVSKHSVVAEHLLSQNDFSLAMFVETSNNSMEFPFRV